MIEAPSLAARVTRALSLIGVVGATVLIALMIFDLAHERRLVARGGQDRGELELLTLVLFVAITLAMIGIGRLIIERAFAALAQSVAKIETATGAGRGVRLDLGDHPREVVAYGEAINDLLGRLDRIAVQRETFAAQVIHEIKHPLAILVVELDRLGDEAAARLKQDVQRINRIIDQLALLARVDSHNIAPTSTSAIDLAGCAADQLSALAPGAIAAGVDLGFDSSGAATIRGHPELVASAIRNLIENALRVTPAGGTVTVTVGPACEVSVRDGGPGLSSADLDRFCAPFVRGPDPHADGAGLGLAIVAQVASLHDGLLSTDPENRTLTVYFPSDYGPIS